ncbi:MAG: GHKL domain-containing protein [Turicibacter sp.]|nr:GHKL domain-containing protein [Turicibacter sp.]
MISFFVPFWQLLILLMGSQWLLNEKMGRYEFLIQLVVINIIGQGIYSLIKFFAIFFVVAYLIIYHLIKTNNLFPTVLATCVPLIMMVMGDYLAQLVIVIGKKIIPISLTWEQATIIETLMMGGATLLLCYFFKRIFKRIKFFPNLENRYRMLILAQVILLLILLYANIYAGEKQGFSSQHIRLTSVLFVAYGGLLFWSRGNLLSAVIKQSKIEQERVANQQIYDYAHKLEQLYQELNYFRHDYLNILASLGEGIRLEDLEEIKGVYNRVIQPTEKLVKGRDYIFGKLHQMGVIEIKSLLFEKIVRAQTEQIEVRLELEDKIDTFYVDVFPFYRVLAILLDNAIEGAKEANKSYISIVFIQGEEFQQVEIENSCKDEEISLTKIYQPGYSSKGENRGIGLATVQQMIDTNHYLTLQTAYDAGIFRQVLILKRQG